MASLHQLLFLRRLHARTTEGRWRVGSKVGRTIYCGHGNNDLIGVMDTRDDSAFIVAAHEMIVWMVDEIIRLTELVEELQGRAMITEKLEPVK